MPSIAAASRGRSAKAFGERRQSPSAPGATSFDRAPSSAPGDSGFALGPSIDGLRAVRLILWALPVPLPPTGISEDAIGMHA